MTPVELAWLAGWLEGEASFYCIPTQRRSVRLVVQVFSTDLDVLQKAAALMGAKNMTSIPPRECRGTQWKSKGGNRVEISNDEAADLMRKLLPFMGARRTEQITASLQKWDARPLKPFHKVCACGCGKPVFGGPRIIYADGNACGMRAFRARQKEIAA